MISFWGSVNLLEWLIELRKTHLLTRLPSYYTSIILHAHSCATLCNPMELQPARFLCSWDSLGKNTGVGCHNFLHEIFGTCVFYVSCINRWVLYNQHHLGSPNKRISKVASQLPDEEILRVTSQTKELLSSLSLKPGMVALGTILVLQCGSSPKRAKKLSFGILWRLHSIVMID